MDSCIILDYAIDRFVEDRRRMEGRRMLGLQQLEIV